AVVSQYPETQCIVVPVDDVEGGYDYPPEVRFEFREQELDGYRRTAHFLNFSNVDVVSLQHEFGIYGGSAGSHILALLRDLRAPVVTTLHTILKEPTKDQRRVMQQLAVLSTRLVVMSARGREFLEEVYGISPEKVDVIPHGIPDMPFVDPNFYKDHFHVEGKNVLLTFGLLSPNKGIEHVVAALPRILKDFPDTMYIVLGATHPNLVRDHGESYRLSLERQARDLGIHKHVVFYNRFVDLSELMEFIGAADIYITPYLNPAQITSGTLAYSFGCGKAVISTPYWHAEELLADDCGVLVPFADPTAIAEAVSGLLSDPPRHHAMRKRAYLAGREMVWSQVAQSYMHSFQLARSSPTRIRSGVFTSSSWEDREFTLPQLKLNHLWRMTDSVGIMQHAVHDIPYFTEGYCTDDNARALVLAVLMEDLAIDSNRVYHAASTYAAFVHHAFDASTGRFRNFMSFDRRWLDSDGSDDCLGRAIWALGTCVGRSNRRGLAAWPIALFDPALKGCLDSTSPRGWALGLIGIHEYLRRMSGDRLAAQARDELMARLLAQFRAQSAPDWPWFEDVVSYDNARLPLALILSGVATENGDATDVGLRSLRWLCEIQTSPLGCFRPIGVHGFYRRGDVPAAFDQQPLEAYSTASACIEAYRATEDEFWIDQARRAFDWFLGRNDLGQPIYDAATGGCRDGLLEDRINENQGAESTLSWLLGLAEMLHFESTLVGRENRRAGNSIVEPAI
ncbi:MAG TPA: glycosyltransferase family 4 protein, partial [Pirellulaceae bacterium]